MKVIVCGDGPHTMEIMKYVAKIGFDTVVITQNPSIIQEGERAMDVQIINNDPCFPEALYAAGANGAIAVVASHASDEKNILISQLFYSMFNVMRRVALIHTPQYIARSFAAFYSDDHIPITHPISVDRVFIDKIINKIKYPDLDDIITLPGNSLMVSFDIKADSIFIDKSISELEYMVENVYCIGVIHNGQYYNKDSKLLFLVGDKVLIMVYPQEGLQSALVTMNLDGKLKGAIIATDIPSIAEALKEKMAGISVKAVCGTAPDNTSKGSKCDIILGDVLDPAFINSIDTFEDFDYSVFAIHDDFIKNFVCSALFKQCGYEKCVASICSQEYKEMAAKFNIECIDISQIIFGYIFNSMGSALPITNLHHISEQCNIGTMLFDQKCDSYIGHKISKVQAFKFTNRVIAIIRNNQVLISPNEDVIIHANDTAVFTIADQNLKKFLRTFMSLI